ncbi:uncharacterized protein EV420DRAFT_1646768 [Desarmillaria tabescens]|uniref:NAD-dependent epimerase/dehydratase domain-containing protein n=1 Tax=Armillaria tabescens TaxID=1929756 RepID=A0AA39JXS3_ARMTA|nr:uncharacterized protein EV420DRAFT_1646768 [Desarmillaria tabescens]KAK0449771.1 hypothetical protein EV420DRAFT_1646768 [Desarmillaria tabescens]
MPCENSSKIIFVTGGTGFIGFQVLVQLLDLGYSVRASARGKKVDLLSNALSNYKNLEVVGISDIFNDDLSNVLKGLCVRDHTHCCTLPGAESERTIRDATEGCLHILNAAVKAGVERIVATSSAATFPAGGPYGPDDWFPVTREDAKHTNNGLIYLLAKKLADQVFMKFGESHPELNISLLGPGLTFGPFPPGFEQLLPEPNYKSLSSNAYLYALLRPDNVHFPVYLQNGAIDVRDVARAHLLALESPPARRKRFAIVSPHQSSYKTALEILARERPALKYRLADQRRLQAKIEKSIGLKTDSYIPWAQTVLETVDSLLAIENHWKAKGFHVEVPSNPTLPIHCIKVVAGIAFYCDLFYDPLHLALRIFQ